MVFRAKFMSPKLHKELTFLIISYISITGNIVFSLKVTLNVEFMTLNSNNHTSLRLPEKHCVLC